MDKLSIGETVVVDRGKLGLDFVNRMTGEKKIWISDEDAEELRVWLNLRAEPA